MPELSMEDFFNKSKREKYRHCTDQPGSEDVPHGKIKYEKYDNYYNVQNVIATSGPVDPQDFDSPVYNRERIHDNLERNADVIYVVNPLQKVGGVSIGVPLFVIQSHKSVMGFSPEVPIDPNQQKEFYNIYEIRLRSELVNHIYRVSTFPVRDIS